MANLFSSFFSSSKNSKSLLDSDFRALFEASSDAIIITDDDRNILAANPANEQMFNDRLDNIVGTRIDEYMCPDFHDLEQLWRRFMSEGELKGEICLLRHDGSKTRVTFNARANFIRGKHLIIVRDVRAQRQALDLAQANAKRFEEANMFLEDTKKALVNALEDFSSEKELVEQEKKKLEALIESIGDGVFVTDINGHITLMNAVAEQMAGIQLKDGLGQHYTRVFHFVSEDAPSAPYNDFVHDVVHTGRIKELSNHLALQRVNGKLMPVSNSAAPIKNTEGKITGCVVVLRDFTRERQLELAKDEFLSVAAHQLRTPLGALRWGMELLSSGDLGPITDKERSMINTYHDNILRMITLVNDLLDVSRIDQGRIRDEPVETDVEELVAGLIKFLSNEAMEKHVQLNLDQTHEPIPIIIIDKKRLSQVVENIIANAIKYNRTSGGKVDIVLGQDRNNLIITVRDNGIGIPPQSMQKLFTKFFRAENAVLSNTEGTGLGLYLAKSYVERWGGTIKVQSVVNQGTTVTVTIPKLPRSQPKVRTASAVPKPGASL